MGRAHFKFAELFAGIGGLGAGFTAQGGQCVFANEYDKFAAQTYNANYNTAVDCRDVRQVKTQEIPAHDILLAGFPCQPFSLAGVSKRNALGMANGFDCVDQGNLFFEVLRVLEALQPQAFLLENVKNLQRHNGGEAFKLIEKKLKGLGYSFSARVIDGAHWVPQHRERVFMVGFRNPDCEFDFDSVRTPTQGPTLESILLAEHQVDPKYILSDHQWNYHQAYAAKHAAKGNGFGYGLVGPKDVTRTLSARYYKDGSEIFVRRRGNPRRLTPRECARLMGFNDGFKIPVSDTQAYKQFGNSVVVPAVKAIAKQIAKWL